MHALIIGRGTRLGTPDGHQLDGFHVYRRQLKRRLGFTFDQVDLYELPQIERAVRESRADVAFILLTWREKVEDVRGMFERLYNTPDRPKLIFLDYYAQTSSPYFSILPFVDLYVKRQLLRDRSLYQRDFRGGYIFTDFYADHAGLDLDGWYFGSKPDPSQMHKLVVGWNLGVTGRYRQFLRLNRLWPKPWKRRRYDLNARIGLAENHRREWYQMYREETIRETRKLGERFTLTGQGRVKPWPYRFELRDSRIVVSPFGWGELCFRDYEAVVFGALLVKPSMAHLETSPDIFAEDETYVPVRWDNADLTERCTHYLEHPEEAKRIIRNAQTRLHDYYEHGGFTKDIQRILAALP